MWVEDNMKCSRIFRHAPVLILLVCFASRFLPAQTSTDSSPQPTSSVPASRLARLRHGINASDWFAQVYDTRGYTKEHFQSWTTASDIALMKSMGFDHVRLSVNPQPMMANHPPNEIPAEYLG
jgi:aryl-phospho-beta-D-glucosidase BglC (GH1 family)